METETETGDTMNLLDIIAATEAKDEAITRVGHNADPQWVTACYNTIVQIAFNKQRFTTDDVWDALDRAKVATPHEPKAIGAVLRQAAKDGLIYATDDHKPSARVACHARPLRIWEQVGA